MAEPMHPDFPGKTEEGKIPTPSIKQWNEQYDFFFYSSNIALCFKYGENKASRVIPIEDAFDLLLTEVRNRNILKVEGMTASNIYTPTFRDGLLTTFKKSVGVFIDFDNKHKQYHTAYSFNCFDLKDFVEKFFNPNNSKTNKVKVDIIGC